MDSAVPSVIEEPWFTKTRVRYEHCSKVTHVKRKTKNVLLMMCLLLLIDTD